MTCLLYTSTLEQVLKLDSNKIFLLEIKEVNIDQKKFQTMIQKFSSKKIYVMSFFNKVIQELSRTKKREKSVSYTHLVLVLFIM